MAAAFWNLQDDVFNKLFHNHKVLICFQNLEHINNQLFMAMIPEIKQIDAEIRLIYLCWYEI